MKPLCSFLNRSLIRCILSVSLTAGPWLGSAPGQAVLDAPRIMGTNVTLGWSSTVPVGALQVAPSPDGPWTTVSDASMTVSNSVVTSVGLPARFFRVLNNGVPGPSATILPKGLQQSPQLTFAAIQRLASATPEGNTRLDVRFAEGTIPNSLSNVVPVLLENRVALLRDDGQGLDREPRDGIFSTAIFVDSGELEEANAHVDALPPSRRFTQQFVDRRRVGEPVIPLTKFPITNFNAGQLIPLLTTNRFGPLKVNCPAGSPLAFDWRKTMMITDLSVVADPGRTHEPCPWPTGSGPGLGKWTFGRLMTDMANFPVTGIKPSVFAREWLRSWEVDQVINTFLVPKVNPIKAKLVNAWEAESLANGFPPGELDLSIAPFRLCAIVNRLDLRPNPTFSYGAQNSSCNAGEARFVFCAVSPENCSDLRFLVIFEYGIPICGCSKVKDWAMKWADLNTRTATTVPSYNEALEAITDQFAGPNSDPGKLPNLSAINQIRSNEILGSEWVMREWTITPPGGVAPGFLQETTVKNTPDASFNLDPSINAFLSPPSVPTVPLFFGGNPFLGGSGPMGPPGFIWDGSPTMALDPKRHQFALNTCNGCHRPETKTLLGGSIPFEFTHVDCRPHPSTFQTAALSDFLTGMNMPKQDPLDPSTTHTFADLDRRVIDMDELIHCPCSPFGIIFNRLAIGLAAFAH